MHEPLGRGLDLDARALEEIDESGGGAVQNGNFFRRDVDVEVVDAYACTGRHQVFDGAYAHVALSQGGGQARVIDRIGAHGDGDGRGQVGAPEHDARVHGRRAQRQLNALAAVQANACGVDDGFEGALRKHGFR